MAITAIAALHTTDAVTPGATTEFTTSGRGFWIHTEDMLDSEMVYIYGARPSTSYNKLTNENGAIHVRGNPNITFIDLPAGTYRLGKTATSVAIYVGWEEE